MQVTNCSPSVLFYNCIFCGHFMYLFMVSCRNILRIGNNSLLSNVIYIVSKEIYFSSINSAISVLHSYTLWVQLIKEFYCFKKRVQNLL